MRVLLLHRDRQAVAGGSADAQAHGDVGGGGEARRHAHVHLIKSGVSGSQAAVEHFRLEDIKEDSGGLEGAVERLVARARLAGDSFRVAGQSRV